MRKTVIFTNTGMAEAADALAFLLSEGYRAFAVPREICLWDEDALGAFAAPYAPDLLGVVHPAPAMIPGSVESVTEEQWQ